MYLLRYLPSAAKGTQLCVQPVTPQRVLESHSQLQRGQPHMNRLIQGISLLMPSVNRNRWNPNNPLRRTRPTRAVVLVELFTSEGCSSCPPADALLRQINGTKTAAGQLIVGISEHVTYWNSLGWSDPFSSDSLHESSECLRQPVRARQRLHATDGRKWCATAVCRQ